MNPDFEYAGQEIDLGFAHKFRLESHIADTSFGVVCRATWLQNGSTVAVKTVLDIGRLDPEDRLDCAASLRREASLINRLRDANVVRFMHQGSHRAMPVLVLEALDKTLEKHVNVFCHDKDAPRLPLPEALVWVRQAALGLAAIHRAGLQHLDIKRANLLLTPPSPLGSQLKIADFDTCLADDGREHTFEGTLGCLAPEQAVAISRREDGRYLYSTDARSDVYALGLLLFQLVTGARTEFSQSNRKAFEQGRELGLWRERESFTGELTSNDLARFENPAEILMQHTSVNASDLASDDQNTWHPRATVPTTLPSHSTALHHKPISAEIPRRFGETDHPAVDLLQKLCAPRPHSRPANGQAALAFIDEVMMKQKCLR